MKNTERNLLDILYANIIDYLNGVPCANMEPLEEEIRERLYNFICKRFSVSTLEEIPNERSGEVAKYLEELLTEEEIRMTAELLDEKRSFLNRVVFTTVVDRFEDEYCKAFTIFSGCCKKELLESICGYFDVDEIYEIDDGDISELLIFCAKWEMSEELKQAINIFKVTEIFEKEKQNDRRGTERKNTKGRTGFNVCKSKESCC